jgi:arylamine N-acetyltransferase
MPRFDWSETNLASNLAGHLNNIIAALPGPGGTRLTLFNARFNVRHPSGQVERQSLQNETEYRNVLKERFGIRLSEPDLKTALAYAEQRGTRGPPHPFFA